MAKIIKSCYSNKNISKELKEEFFKKLRDLCCLYSVHIGVDDIELPKEYIDSVNDSDHIPNHLDGKDVCPTLFFEFHNGDTYYWDQNLDKDLEYGNFNTYVNCEDENDIININGVRFDQEQNE